MLLSDQGNNYALPEMANDRWYDFTARGRLPSELGATLEATALDKSPVNVTIAGHSFIKHLDRFACSKYGYFHNSSWNTMWPTSDA